MKHIDLQPHKREGNILYYFNGRKWLIRETLNDTKEAEKLDSKIKIKKNGRFQATT